MYPAWKMKYREVYYVSNMTNEAQGGLLCIQHEQWSTGRFIMYPTWKMKYTAVTLSLQRTIYFIVNQKTILIILYRTKSVQWNMGRKYLWIFMEEGIYFNHISLVIYIDARF